MIQEYAKVMRNNTVCLPKAIREVLNIEVADMVSMKVRGNGIYLKKTPRSWRELVGIAKKSYAKYGGGEAYLRHERAGWSK